MRLGRRSSLGAVVLLVAGLVAAPALGAPGRQLDSETDSGFPGAFVTGGLKRPREIVVRVTATPDATVDVRWDVSCSRKAKGRFGIGVFSMGGRAQRKLPLPTKRPDECIANVLVAYDDADLEGTLKVELFARPRKGGKR